MMTSILTKRNSNSPPTWAPTEKVESQRKNSSRPLTPHPTLFTPPTSLLRSGPFSRGWRGEAPTWQFGGCFSPCAHGRQWTGAPMHGDNSPRRWIELGRCQIEHQDPSTGGARPRSAGRSSHSPGSRPRRSILTGGSRHRGMRRPWTGHSSAGATSAPDRRSTAHGPLVAPHPMAAHRSPSLYVPGPTHSSPPVA
jgi:hypothetical protein